MPATIEDAFDDFLVQLRAAKAEIEAAASHRASIKAKLEEKFGMTSFFRTGSFGNGTNISGYSDVDYFAVIPTSNLKQDSSYSLTVVANALRERFPLTENIRVNGPAVRIPFGLDGAEATEIVPVDEKGLTLLGFRSFDMPDGSGGWKFSAPESHNAYVRRIDEKHSGQVKSLIRFVKAWKFFRNVPINSFYLEIRTAQYADSENVILYDADVWKVLSRIFEDGIANISDPRFPRDGFILKGCSTDNQRFDAMSKLGNAVTWAREGFLHRTEGRIASAFKSWQLVYDHRFPTYTPA